MMLKMLMMMLTLSEALPSLPPPKQPHQGATPPEHNFDVLKIHLVVSEKPTCFRPKIRSKNEARGQFKF